MTVNFDGWCRRIDLSFRARYPYLTTRLFKLNEHSYALFIEQQIDDLETINNVFEREIRYITAPIKLIDKQPEKYEYELDCISDEDIPSNFEGFPYTLSQLHIHIASIHKDVKVAAITTNHQEHIIVIELDASNTYSDAISVQITANKLKLPFDVKVILSTKNAPLIDIGDEVFIIAPSQAKKNLGCEFVERDESLWYENVEKFYDGSFNKSELYFFDENKSCCLVNFSLFKNANLRNHLLLYDVVYCILPLAENMQHFLEEQKINRDDILNLVSRGRLKIINLQPENRLDYGFINELFRTNPAAVISRRAISALSAIDLAELNKNYIFNDPELESYIYPLIKDISDIFGINHDIVSNYLLWPRKALRSSLDTLNQAGPRGIARYGVNNTIMSSWQLDRKDVYEFEFTVNSDSIHLAHALDATYFPFYTEEGKYTDHPYASMMGSLLNFYKKSTFQTLDSLFIMPEVNTEENKTLSLISTFDINDYIPISDFEAELSSCIVRRGMNSLFSELNMLNSLDRNIRIQQYNAELDKFASQKKIINHALDLCEDTAGLFLPFLGTGKKIFLGGMSMAKNKFKAIQAIYEFIEDKSMRKDINRKNVSLLSKINRVARLKRNIN
ncbi:hypothetical protein [Aeromonas veronii]|uniref:hypothetical protein n=1 Tax=Aeromonas veronii TaxID=654 RepID=UPI00398212DB